MFERQVEGENTISSVNCKPLLVSISKHYVQSAHIGHAYSSWLSTLLYLRELPEALCKK